MKTKNKENKTALWFERTFTFNLSKDHFDQLLNRLLAFPFLLHQVITHSPIAIPVVTNSKKWSVQENIGHLFLLEQLWLTRFQEIKDEKEHMMIADLNNTATSTSAFNTMSVEQIYTSFEQARAKTIIWLNEISEEDLQKQSIHPRLHKPMNIIDLMYFVAEHDEHHLHAIQAYLQHRIE